MSSPATSAVCARITAADIEVGDRVARQRSQEFLEVVRLRRLVATVRLEFEDGSIDWPRQDASWWRELPPVAFTAAVAGERVGPAASGGDR